MHSTISQEIEDYRLGNSGVLDIGLNITTTKTHQMSGYIFAADYNGSYVTQQRQQKNDFTKKLYEKNHSKSSLE